MIHILLAEDNIGDVMLVKEALAVHHIEGELHVVEDGQKALDFVATMGGPGCSPCPDLMLLDMNLPKADGTAVLAAFRKHRRLQRNSGDRRDLLSTPPRTNKQSLSWASVTISASPQTSMSL